MPEVLKNAIDCASPPYGHSATGKPAGIIGALPGMSEGVFDQAANIANASTREFLRG
jgi:NAD(P)H-dependent FMN reductase